MEWHKKPLAVWGLILLTFGFILNVLMFYMVWPSTYLFFLMMTIGFAFIVISLIIDRIYIKRIDKLIVQLILIPFPVILFWLLYIGKLAESEKYFIPDGYVGRVFVFHNNDGGTETEYENDSRIYRIENDGVLKTKFNENKGMIPLKNLQFLYIDSVGKRESVPLNWGNNIDSTQLCIFGRTFGDFGGVVYQEFIIDTLFNAKYYSNVRTNEMLRLIRKHDLIDLKLETALRIIKNN
ncbi:MAG: hypothetical protein HRT71_17310 [Flavobacteriales bacterium]|nr:hypothetical protein [Flavobacteriales bacterium]